MHEERARAFGSARQRARDQARERGERAPRRAWGDARAVSHEARAQRQPWIERAPRDIGSGDDGLHEEASRESRKGRELWPASARRQEAHARPRREDSRYRAGDEIARARVREEQPESEESRGAPEKSGAATQRVRFP